MLIRIVSPHFVAGYDLDTGNIAPIIKYMAKWDVDSIITYTQTKGWKIEIYESTDCIYRN